MTKTEDVKRDIADISKMLGGQLGSDRGQITPGQRYPSSTIDTQGKSFNELKGTQRGQAFDSSILDKHVVLNISSKD